MLTWQKRARAGVLVIAVGVAAVVFLSTRRREAVAPPAAVPRVDPSAVVETSGAVLMSVKGEKQNFEISAQRQLSYPDGSSKLVGVTVTSTRGGKKFTAQGDEAVVTKLNADQSKVELNRNVRLTASDGLEVLASSATYSQNEGIVRAPGAVTFKRGRMTGKGVDFSYDENRDTIGLADQTNVRFAPDETGANGADITAGAALLARKDNFASFERAVNIVRPNQVISADRALADLTADEKHITALNLHGNSRITLPEAKPGGLAGMSGEVIVLKYADQSDVLQSGALNGTSALRIANDPGAAERTLAAETLDFAVGPDGTTVTSLNARQKVALELPGQKAQPSKAIRSESLVGTGTPDRGLTSATFSENVEYRETGGSPAVQRVVTSKTLETALNGGLGDIREARFTGDVRFKDGQTQATAAAIRYQVASGEVGLSGNVGTAFPRVVTDQIAVDATTIDMTLDGPRMKARSVKEPVRALMQPAKPGAKGQGRKTPGLMQQDKAVNGTSTSLQYDGNTSSSEFTGAAQLWQEDTLIKAETIQVNGENGNLSATGGVESRFRLQSTDTKTGAKETKLARGTGQTMTYEDAARTIIYTTDAHLDGPQGDLTARSIHVFLAQGSQEVERIEAFENVTLKEPERITTGNHLRYVAANEEYEVTAAKEKMVQMLSRSDDGCKQSTGDKLTFSRSSETVRVDSHEETRSQTKSVACSGLPPRAR